MKYKLSKYVVITDPVNEVSQRVAFSTRKVKKTIITDACYKALVENFVDEIPDTIQKQLLDRGVIVDANCTELEEVISENIEETFLDNGSLYEVIQPSANCQLGCYYCGQEHRKHSVSQQVIDKILDRIIYKFNAGNYKDVHVGWFGAEPLMGLQQMREIDTQLRERLGPDVPVGGHMVSNGLSLKKNIFLEMVNKFKLNKIEITLDGIKEYHDAHRYTKSGNESFDIIYKNLKDILTIPDFKDLGCRIIIRCNVDEKNVDGVEPLIRKFAEDGLHILISQLYFVGVYSWGGNDAHKKSLTKEAFAMQKLKWDMLKMKLGYPNAYRRYARKKVTCIATGGESEMYDAYGNTFNCTEISYAGHYKNTEYDLGNLIFTEPSHKFEKKPLNDWYQKVRDTKEFPCHSCPLLPICGGSCPKSWVEGNPACPPFKFNIKKELELNYILRKTNDLYVMEEVNRFENSLSIEQFNRVE